MAISDGLRGGGIYYDVRLNFATLDRDLAELAKRTSRSSVAAGATGSGAGGGGMGALVAMSAAVGSVTAQFRSLATSMQRGTDGIVDAVQRVARSTAALAKDAADNAKIAHDFRREERRQFHAAHMSRLGARAFFGERRTIDRAEGFARLPADVRLAGGVGFDRMLRAQKSGQAEKAVAPVVAEIMQAGSRAARTAVRDAGRMTRAGGYAMRPGPAPVTRGALPPTGDIPLLEQLPMGGNLAGLDRNRRRRGMIGVGGPMPLGSMGTRAEFGVALRTAAEGARRMHAALSAAGHGGMLALNRMMAAARGVEVRIGRLGESTRYLRATIGGLASVLTSPFRAALRSVGLFDSRVGLATHSLRLLQRSAGGLGSVLALPFKVALSPLSGLFSALKMVVGQLHVVGTMMATAFIGKGIRGASDLNETVNKVNVVFGQSAGRVTGFADTMASKFGIVRNESLDAAAQIGLIAQAAGMTQAESAKMGVEFTQLAGDLASFQNLSFDDALQKIRSGLVGEAEPMRRVGVLLSEDAVKARGLAMGFELVNGQLSQGDKVKARAAIITEQLATAHGDLAKTATGPANLFRELRGRIDNAATALGQALLPAWRELLLLLNDVMGGGSMAGTAIMDAATAVGGALQGAIHFVRQMWASWEDGRQLAMLGFTQIGEMARVALTYIKDAFVSLFSWLSDNWLTIAGNLAQVLIAAFDYGIRTAMAAAARNIPGFETLFGQVEAPKAFSAPGLLSGTSDLALPTFSAPALVTDEMRALAAKIATTTLRGDEGAGAGAVPKPAELLAQEGEEAGDAGAGKAARSRVGELLGARELLAMLQSSASEREKDKATRDTARNTARSNELLENIYSRLNLVPVMS